MIRFVPLGCVYGFLLCFGSQGLSESDIWQRIKLYCCTSKDQQHRNRQGTSSSSNIGLVPVEPKVVHCFTIIQLILTIIMFSIVQFSMVGYIFPALFLVAVGIRYYALPCCIKVEDIQCLEVTTTKYNNDQYEQHPKIPIDTTDSHDDDDDEIDIPAFLDAKADEDETTYHTPTHHNRQQP